MSKKLILMSVVSIIVIIYLLLYWKYWSEKISNATKKREFIRDCIEFQKTAKFIVAPPSCEEQWNKTQGK